MDGVLSHLVRVHWVWAVALLEERVIIILDPLLSHTGVQAHRQIVDKMWHRREAVIANSSSPRDPPPIVPALEEQRGFGWRTFWNRECQEV